jgi:hypothetical protein
LGKLIVTIPDAIREKVREIAERENISVDEFVTSAVEDKLSALQTKEYLAERSTRGSKKRFNAVLEKVRNRKPEKDDVL